MSLSNIFSLFSSKKHANAPSDSTSLLPSTSGETSIFDDPEGLLTRITEGWDEEQTKGPTSTTLSTGPASEASASEPEMLGGEGGELLSKILTGLRKMEVSAQKFPRSEQGYQPLAVGAQECGDGPGNLHTEFCSMVGAIFSDPHGTSRGYDFAYGLSSGQSFIAAFETDQERTKHEQLIFVHSPETVLGTQDPIAALRSVRVVMERLRAALVTELRRNST